MRYVFSFITFLVVLVASSIIVSTTTAATPTRTATNTRTPTLTKTPTLTRTPTNTPTPRPCKVGSSTTSNGGPCYTVTPNETATARADKITATAESRIATQTQRAVNIGSTATQRAVNIGGTATSVKSTAEFFAEFNKIDYRELVSYAGDHVGEKVIVRGRVFNVVDGGFQAYFAGTYEAFVVLNPATSGSDRIYENNVVTVYGTVIGTYEGTNAYGGTISQPEILAEYIKKG